MPLFLTSLAFDGLSDWLTGHGVAGPVPVITNASRELTDQDAIVAMACDELRSGGFAPRPVDVADDGTRALEDCPAVVMTGGDPFRLLTDLRRSGADRVLVQAHRRGTPIAGQSAGAMVCAANLEPVTLTSPFTAPAGLALGGLDLTEQLVLPHHGRAERNASHRRAALRYGADRRLTALWDDESLLIDSDGSWSIRRDRWITRQGRADDADAVTDIFHQAARQAWAPFLGSERLAGAPQDTAVWASRVTRSGFLVTADDEGPCSFVYARGGPEPDTGEVDVLYTHPRAAGLGVGRRLLERATWRLLCDGFRQAVLWTEARNARARSMYEANGWTLDGGVDERTYLDVAIRNLRYRLDLTVRAGGP